MGLETLQKQINSGKSHAPQPKPNPAVEVQAASGQYHTVEAGETLYSISKKYDLKVEDLLKMNQMSKDSVLKVGQKLLVHSAPAN